MVQKRHTKLIKEYKHIAELCKYPTSLYNDICNFISEKNPALKEKLDKHKWVVLSTELEQFVDENYKEVREFLLHHWDLNFIVKQINVDKIIR